MATSTASGTWLPISEIGPTQPIASTSTTKNHEIGHTIKCRDMGTTAYGEAEFVYLTGVASVAVGDYCIRDGDLVARGAVRAVGSGCVAMSACVASNYGWFQVTGKAVINGTAGDADDAAMAIGAAGVIVTQAGSTQLGDSIFGLRSAAAVTDDVKILCVINHPKTGDTDNSGA